MDDERPARPSGTQTLLVLCPADTRIRICRLAWIHKRRRGHCLGKTGVARPILKASWKTPKTVLLRSLQWSSLRWRREITSMTHCHDLLCTRPPHLAQSLFLSLVAKDSLEDWCYLWLSRHAIRILSFYRSAMIWNTLPTALQLIESKSAFKKALELHWAEFQYNPTQRFLPQI